MAGSLFLYLAVVPEPNNTVDNEAERKHRETVQMLIGMAQTRDR